MIYDELIEELALTLLTKARYEGCISVIDGFSQCEEDNYYITPAYSDEGWYVEKTTFADNRQAAGEQIDKTSYSANYHIHADNALAESQDQVAKGNVEISKIVSSSGQSNGLELEGAGFTFFLVSDLSKLKQFEQTRSGSYTLQSILDAYIDKTYDNEHPKWDFSAETQAIAKTYEVNADEIDAYNKTLTAAGENKNGKGDGWQPTGSANEYQLAEIFSNDTGNIRVQGLPYGTYLVVETTVPHDLFQAEPFIVTVDPEQDNNPWGAMATPKDSVMTGSDSYQKFTVLDEEIEVYLRITKIDEETGKPVLLPDTAFQIYWLDEQGHYRYDSNGNPKLVTMTNTVNGHLTKDVNTFHTNGEGILTLPEKLPLGKYRIVEVTGPNRFYNEWLDSAGYENGVLADDADGSYYVDFEITTDRIYAATGDKNENGMDNLKYRNTKQPAENYILTENVRFSTDSHAHKHNLNIIVIGGSGSGKTRFYVKPNALQLIGSYLFLDPKGELTRTLGRIMETKGISVTVLDLVHFQGHYNPMAYLETDEDAIKLAFAIVNNTKPKDAPSSGDKFWDDSSVLLISALILYLMYEAPASEQNFSTLMYMILNCQVSENEMVENPLMMLFGELERRDPQHPAVLQFKSFMLGAKKTLQSILISAAANLYMFNSRKFAEMTSRDEMFLPRMGLEQRALFIVLPDNDTTFNFIATMLYTQLFDQLFRLADSTPEYNGALPVHVRLMMDEFANVALPKNFKNILAVCRSRNISCDIILQNIAQLKSLFKDDWEGIIGNCDTLLYLGGNEYGTYEYLSKILGKETERTKSQSIGKGSRGSSSDSLQTAGRELCMPDEIRRMRDDECLLLMRSEDPVIDKKYNLLHHPNVKCTPDAGGEPYVMPPDYMGDAVTITMGAVAAATAPEITEEMYEQLDYLEKHLEENYYENEENFSQYDQGD